MRKATGKLAEVKKEVKAMIIAQNGKLYNYNHILLMNRGYDSTDIQNATNYFRYSPQQATFRAQFEEIHF